MNESEMWEQAVLMLLKREPDRAYCKTMIADQFPGLRGSENAERFNATMERLISKGLVKEDREKNWTRYQYIGNEAMNKEVTQTDHYRGTIFEIEDEIALIARLAIRFHRLTRGLHQIGSLNAIENIEDAAFYLEKLLEKEIEALDHLRRER